MMNLWKAIIVDDEPIIRLGIKASLDWKQENIEIVGEFANGVEALEYINHHIVHIVITDIKMPLMDGLQLTKQALESFPRTRFIFISSYNDFEFVREGLKLGVVDYVLKHTLEPRELLQAIAACKEQLEKYALQSTNELYLLEEKKYYQQQLKKYLIGEKKCLSKQEYPSWFSQGYTVVRIELLQAKTIEDDKGFVYLSLLLDVVSKYLVEAYPKSILLDSDEHHLILIVPQQSVDSEQWLQQLYNQLQNLYLLDGKYPFSLSSDNQVGLIHLEHALNRTALAIEQSFFCGSGIYPVHLFFQIKQIDDPKQLTHLYDYLPSLSIQNIKDEIIQWLNKWEEGGISPRALKEDGARFISRFLLHHVDPYTLVTLFEQIYRTNHINELKQKLLTFVEEWNNHSYSKASVKPIDKAIAYMNQHFTENLALQDVADIVHMSKNYFSTLFKSTTGTSFIDYLIHLRVERAKYLIKHTHFKIYEIAYECGFNDVKYFSKLFKKAVGITANEYRDLEQGEHIQTGDGTWNEKTI